jgi:hypothetical protein
MIEGRNDEFLIDPAYHKSLAGYCSVLPAEIDEEISRKAKLEALVHRSHRPSESYLGPQ